MPSRAPAPILSTGSMCYLSTADLARSSPVLRTPLFVSTSTIPMLTLLKLVLPIRLHPPTSTKSGPITGTPRRQRVTTENGSRSS